MDSLATVTELVGVAQISRDAKTLTEFGGDRTENVPHLPDAVIRVPSLQALVEIVKIASRERIPLIPRVAGTNLGGLTIPSHGGWVLELTAMNKIVELDLENMVCVVEPGVTFGQLKEELDRHTPALTIGFPLSPPDTSVMANCLLDGLGNLSLKHGTMGEWLSGLEVVRGDGSLLRTGSWALGVPVPFGRAPLPDLTGLFVSMQGSTGIVCKAAVQLWPAPVHRARSFVFCQDRNAALKALVTLPRLDVLDDVGALSWPAGKMLFGVNHPGARDPGEPEVFLYLDIGAADQTLMRAKQRVIVNALADLRSQGFAIEDPLDVHELVRLEPRLARFAEFPTRLDFLLDHPDGGLTWVGTYGPMSRAVPATDVALAVMERHGFPPLMVARSMKGGHFGVLRFIEVFLHADASARERVTACNQELCDRMIEHGFVMYKTPGWVVERYRPRLDAGFARLLGEVQGLLDPGGIMNPGRWAVRSRKP